MSEEAQQALESIKGTTAREFGESSAIFDESVQSHQLMCRIYQRFAGPEDVHHNCLGCNFDDLTEQISKFLSIAADNTPQFELHHLFSMYTLLLNSLWERVTDVFNIIGVPDSYRTRHFSPLIRVRRWANFFKHPKTFGWVVHHPVYTIENSDHHNGLKADAGRYRFVNDEFLKTYYSSDATKNAGKLRGEFVGFERSVAVVYPDISQLTTQICECLTRFVQIITQNPVYVEMLHDTSTIQGYLDREEESRAESYGD